MTSGVRSAPVTSGSVASGSLGGVPLAHALVYIRNKQLSGVLELHASVARHAALVFWRGRVLSSMTTPTIARFGTVVYELGLINAETLDATTLDSANQKRPLMDLLLERGAITEAQRDQVLVEQVRRRIQHLFTLPPSTTFTFREGRPTSTEPLVTVDPIAPVWRGLCDFPPDARAGEVLGRIADHPLRLVSEAALELAELTPKDRALCDALTRTPMTLSQLRAASTLPTQRVDLLAYFLVIAKCVEIDGDARTSMPSSAMWAAMTRATTRSRSTTTTTAPTTAHGGEPAQPHTSSPRLTAAARPLPPRGPLDLGAAEIRRRAAGLATESPFATLGLIEGASGEAARAAYFRLARLWNPDRLPLDLEAVRGDVVRIFAHMTQAHGLLTDPAARPAVVSRTRT